MRRYFPKATQTVQIDLIVAQLGLELRSSKHSNGWITKLRKISCLNLPRKENLPPLPKLTGQMSERKGKLMMEKQKMENILHEKCSKYFCFCFYKLISSKLIDIYCEWTRAKLFCCFFRPLFSMNTCSRKFHHTWLRINQTPGGAGTRGKHSRIHWKALLRWTFLANKVMK